jgi:hypothetical protein
MGYASGGGQRLVDDDHVWSAYAARGDGSPLILQSSRAVLTWSHRFEGDRMLVKVAPFGKGVLPLQICVRVFDEIGQLLGAANVEAVAGTDRAEGLRAQ